MLTQDRAVSVAVISDDMVIASVCKDNKDMDNAPAISDDDSVDFTLLKKLQLSYKNIFKIDNLVTMNALVALRLDNNVIEKIEGIGHLTNLI